MSQSVEFAVERLVDTLINVIEGALIKEGFYPSVRFQEELAEVVRQNIGMGK